MKLRNVFVFIFALFLGVAIPAFALNYGGTTTERLDRIETKIDALTAIHNTTIPPTTTTVAPTTTIAPTTTVAPTTTAATTTLAPTTTVATTTTVVSAAACGLTNAAFCETFDAPAGTGSKTGDLNPVLWGVSRLGDINPGGIVNDIADTRIDGCGTTALVAPPADVRICNGQMFEGMNDNHSVVNLDTYPKQPFDFAGRTGKVVFDVSADSDGSHGAWPEFVITDKPVPAVRGSISLQVPPLAANEVGFALDGGTTGPGGSTGVGLVFVTKAGVYSEPSFTVTDTVLKSVPGGPLNHFEVRLSTNRMEVWGTDPGSSTLKQLAVADNLGLTFSRGLVWLNDVHYNARKAVEPCECGTQYIHTFVWDNLGFDGPKTYRDIGFDVPNNTIRHFNNNNNGEWTTQIGYQVGTGPTSLSTESIPATFPQTPTAAQVVMNHYSFSNATNLTVSVNGNTPIAVPNDEGFHWHSVSVPVPLSQIVAGPNTLTFRSSDGSTSVSNVSIIMVAAGIVP